MTIQIGLNRLLAVMACLALVLLLAVPEGQAQGTTAPKDFAHYKALNDAETRLARYKDDDAALRLKVDQLAVINASRKRHRVPPVQLDILASRVANQMALEAASQGFWGHWNTRGEKPYHRYAFAGGVDHVSENAAAQSTSGRFNSGPASIAQKMRESHGRFMAEKRPHDGHKQTVINKNHNYVGIGYGLVGGEFRYYEEFIDRYFTFGQVPRQVKANRPFTIDVTVRPGKHLGIVTAFYEPVPKSMSVAQVKRRGSYTDFTNTQASTINPLKVQDYRKGNTYTLPFEFARPGLYYIQVYEEDRPYRLGTKYSNAGKIQGSGIVVRVGR